MHFTIFYFSFDILALSRLNTLALPYTLYTVNYHEVEVLLSSSSHKECICWMPLNQMNLMKNLPDWKIYCNNICLNFLFNTQKVHKRTKSLQYSTSISRYFIEGYTVVTRSTQLLLVCENGLESQFKIPWYFQVFSDHGNPDRFS